MTFLIPAALVRRFTQTAKPSRTFHVHQLPPNRFRGIASTAYVKSSNKENGEPIDLKREIERIGDMFTVARDELEYAEEAKGTTYYNEDKQTAQQAVEDTIKAYHTLKSRLSAEQQADVERRIGLRVLELKAQLDALAKEELEDH